MNKIPLFLERQIEKKKLCHAYLLYGPGKKKKIAVEFGCRILASYLKIKPSRMLKILKSGGYSDFIILEKKDKKATIGINQAKEIIRKVSLKSSGRVVIISEAELLTLEAANALLKTIEEPGQKNVFILTVKNINQLAPTIVSRCQNIYLPPQLNKKIKPQNEAQDFLKANLIGRFALAKEITEKKGPVLNLLSGLEEILLAELRENYQRKNKKLIAREIKAVNQCRTLLKRNISARLVLEDLSLRLKERR